MIVAGLDSNNDWNFGRGLAVYKLDTDAIRQNVITRIKSFQGDWYLDQTAEIDWISLLGQKNAQTQILREIERVVLSTDGVVNLLELNILSSSATIARERRLEVQIRFTDIFTADIFDRVELEL